MLSKKFCSVLVVMMLALATTAGIIAVNDSGSDDETDASVIEDAMMEKQREIADNFNSTIGQEYGITYDEYCYAMEIMSDKIICVTSDEGEIVVSVESSIDAGRFGAEQRGEYFYVYLDSVSVSLILSGGAAGLGFAIGAAIGSAVPALGTLIGGAVGAIVMGAIEGALVTAVMEGLNWDNGIIAKFKWMESYNIFGMRFTFICQPYLTEICPQ